MREKIKVLVIDDDKLVHFVMKQTLESLQSEFDTEVMAVSSGFDALEHLRSFANFPDVIFLDINMPVMNGWDFLNHVRHQNLPLHLMRIALISSSNFESKRNRMAGYSFVQDFIHKPITKEMVREVLEKFVSTQQTTLSKGA